jgi:PAS domain S-box-containing protein
VLVAISIAFGCLISGFGLSLLVLQRAQVSKNVEKAFRQAPHVLQQELSHEVETIEAAMQGLVGNEALTSALAAKDTDRLMAIARPIFEGLKAESPITHFYFHGPDRRCVLRVYNPTRSGDLITRHTAIAAEKTGQAAWGIELGSSGTFTLRVVRPLCSADGTLIGYLELGEEIDHVITHLAGSLGIEFCVAVRKDVVGEKRWAKRVRLIEDPGDWDMHPSMVIIDQTVSDLPEVLIDRLDESAHTHGIVGVDVASDGRRWRAAFAPLSDAGGQAVGDLVMIHDATATYATFRHAALIGAVMCLVAGGTLFAFFAVFLRRIDEDLASRTADLAEANRSLVTEIGQRRRAEKFLQTAIDAMPDVTIAIDRDFRIVLANQAAQSLSNGGDVVGRLRCHELSHRTPEPCDSDERACPLKQVIETATPFVATHEHVDANGDPVLIEVHAAPIFDDDGEVALVIESCRDVTVRTEAERRLRETVAELDQFNRLAVGREMRVLELKKQVNELARQAGVPEPYDESILEAV